MTLLFYSLTLIAPVHSIQYMVQSSIALDKVKEEIKKAIWSIFPILYPKK